jgi:hypothetical protein
MRNFGIIAKLLLISGLCFAQTNEINKDSIRIAYQFGGTILLSNLGSTRIFLKDNTIKKHCAIKEINEYWIVYKKDRVLHDLMIDKIKVIELEDEMRVMYFDEKNKPIIKIIRKNAY